MSSSYGGCVPHRKFQVPDRLGKRWGRGVASRKSAPEVFFVRRRKMTRVVKLAALMLLLLLVAAATATAVGVGLANSCVAQAESWRNRDDCLTSAWKLEQCLDGKRNASRTLPTVGVWE